MTTGARFRGDVLTLCNPIVDIEDVRHFPSGFSNATRKVSAFYPSSQPYKLPTCLNLLNIMGACNLSEHFIAYLFLIVGPVIGSSPFFTPLSAPQRGFMALFTVWLDNADCDVCAGTCWIRHFLSFYSLGVSKISPALAVQFSDSCVHLFTALSSLSPFATATSPTHCIIVLRSLSGLKF